MFCNRMIVARFVSKNVGEFVFYDWGCVYLYRATAMKRMTFYILILFTSTCIGMTKNKENPEPNAKLPKHIS